MFFSLACLSTFTMVLSTAKYHARTLSRKKASADTQPDQRNQNYIEK